IYFFSCKSKFDFNEDEITSYRLSRENLSTDLDFQKILNYEVKLSNLGSVTFILEHQNYEKLITHLDIKPYYTYYITPVFCETDVYRNQLLEIVTENRKRFLNKVNLALSGLLGYFIYQSINHHSKSLDAYEIYQHSYERNKLNGFYNTYETEFNKRNSNIYLAIGTGVALTYLLFFEKWTDLSEYRRDGSSVSLQNSFSQKSLQIKFSYNF
ncbi:MAG: hypothetical protein KDD94_09520, partial [Calditrichaeota bacterium]|nr:hypothetical protein [Calditrichota bacterium]